MDPIDYVIRLQKQNTRSLTVMKPGFIRSHIARHNFFITVHDDEQSDVGYLIHSRPRPGCAVHLFQICVAKHARKRGHARRLIGQLILRCRSYDAAKVITRCPAHLAAASFFPQVGFIQTGQERDRRGLTRLINLYSLDVGQNPTPQNRPRRAQSR